MVPKNFFQATNFFFLEKYMSKDLKYGTRPLSATWVMSFLLWNHRAFWATILHYFLQCFENCIFRLKILLNWRFWGLNMFLWHKTYFLTKYMSKQVKIFSGQNRPHMSYLRAPFIKKAIFSPLNTDFQWAKYGRKWPIVADHGRIHEVET